VVHFDGFFASVYFASFPPEYLHTIHNVNVDNVWEDKVKLHHTRRYNLFNCNDRTEFIKEFVALLRCVAAGEAKIGHLRKDGETIHRSQNDSDEVLHPPQEAMNDLEEKRWRALSAYQYTN